MSVRSASLVDIKWAALLASFHITCVFIILYFVLVDFYFHRVLKFDVTKKEFVKLWDLLLYWTGSIQPKF